MRNFWLLSKCTSSHLAEHSHGNAKQSGINIFDLWYSYPNGVKALKGISLTIDEGMNTLFIGRNGAGKSTLLKHLNGLLKPSQGDVLIGELNTKNFGPSSIAHYVALSFQNPDDQIFCRTVLEEIAYGPKNLGLQNIKTLVEEILLLTGLIELKDCHPYALHQSKRRLLALASTLALDSKFVALDEPTAGMSFQEKDMFARIWEWLIIKNKTPIVISHDLDFFFPLCDRIGILDHGNLVYFGSKKEFLNNEQAKPTLKRASLSLPIITRLGKYLGLKQAITTISELIKEYQSQ